MSLFHGTVGFYRQFRPDIPAEVADVLEAAAPAGSPRRLLDIGTGTGLVVEALRGRFDDISPSTPIPKYSALPKARSARGCRQMPSYACTSPGGGVHAAAGRRDQA